MMGLNESPSEKEGKSNVTTHVQPAGEASMKVPPKRKGNLFLWFGTQESDGSLNESPSEKEGK